MNDYLARSSNVCSPATHIGVARFTSNIFGEKYATADGPRKALSADLMHNCRNNITNPRHFNPQRFDTITVCDRWTDRHKTIAKTALACLASRGKNMQRN